MLHRLSLWIDPFYVSCLHPQVRSFHCEVVEAIGEYTQWCFQCSEPPGKVLTELGEEQHGSLGSVWSPARLWLLRHRCSGNRPQLLLHKAWQKPLDTGAETLRLKSGNRCVSEQEPLRLGSRNPWQDPAGMGLGRDRDAEELTEVTVTLFSVTARLIPKTENKPKYVSDLELQMWVVKSHEMRNLRCLLQHESAHVGHK